MGRFDIPELLIGASILAILVWAVYNRTHRDAGARK
jgi:ABC-type glucose/galactose transport system permease subunit